MAFMREWSMATTSDSDCHAFTYDVATLRNKAKAGHWIETCDGHYVNGTQVVQVWVPTEERLNEYLDDIEYEGER